MASLSDRLMAAGREIANRVVLQPMEGCDCEEDGSPSGLTGAKYLSAAASGAGVIWCEATAVCPEGRTNRRQMFLTEENIASYSKMLEDVREKALAECAVRPLIFLQLTHSGRQSIVQKANQLKELGVKETANLPIPSTEADMNEEACDTNK